MAVTFDGKEYDEETFTDEQKYLVAHLRDIAAKREGLAQQAAHIRMSLEQIGIAEAALTKKLSETLTEKEPVDAD